MNNWEDMEDLLAEEHAVLLDGRLDALPALADRKVALLSRMPPRQVPVHIRDLALANAALLDAAGRGIRSALDRVQSARMAGKTKTYDARGRVTHLTPASSPRGNRA